jgi:hypothetical protein
VELGAKVRWDVVKAGLPFICLGRWWMGKETVDRWWVFNSMVLKH